MADQMEIEIFVSETGRWIVAEWPKETEENAHILKQLRAEEDDIYTLDTHDFPAGRRRIKVIFYEEDGHYEYPEEKDFWLDFELIQ